MVVNIVVVAIWRINYLSLPEGRSNDRLFSKILFIVLMLTMSPIQPPPLSLSLRILDIYTNVITMSSKMGFPSGDISREVLLFFPIIPRVGVWKRAMTFSGLSECRS
jgi:hypothetical protein